MGRGRPGRGVAQVKALEGSPRAKHRLAVVLRTVAGTCSVKEACRELELSEARFHVIRRECLQGALEELEPRPAGRPTVGCVDAEQEAREARLAELETELRRTQARADVAEGRLLIALGEAQKRGARTERRSERKGGGERRRRR